MKLSFIGLGSMGSAMAMRLVEAGHDVCVWNRSSAATEPLVAAGACAAASIPDALERPIVFSMLSNDAAALEVFSAENLATAKPGTIHVNHSSLSLDAADELSARHAAAGVGYIAAPVLGRPPVAALERFHTHTSWPASTSRVAMADPIDPNPMKLSFISRIPLSRQ